MKIAIVGAGIAGLSCAEILQGAGHDVLLFDKARGGGGRMATRRVALPSASVPSAPVSAATVPSATVSFDHGAQYFTVRHAAFAAAVETWETAALAARWPAAGDDAWVATPGMNAIAKAMAQPLTIGWNSRVGSIRRIGKSWFLDAVPDIAFDTVILAVPAEQAAPLLIDHDPAMAAIAQSCPSAPCWTAMVAFEDRIAITEDIVRDRGIIGWAARNSAKPGRSGPEAWVIQATEAFSRDHLEDEPEAIVDTLLAALATQATRSLPEPIVRIAHRWRYARAHAAHHESLWNTTIRLGSIGDWLIAPRIESAWLSGRHLAQVISNANR
jgi:renalase